MNQLRAQGSPAEVQEFSRYIGRFSILLNQYHTFSFPSLNFQALLAMYWLYNLQHFIFRLNYLTVHFVPLLDETNLRDTQEVFLSVGARCFAPCVTTFTSAELDRKEKTCITNCAKRFFEFHSRANARLAEENAAQQGQ